MGRRQDDQLRILAKRFKSLGMSRRNFMKIAAAAAAGTATTAGAGCPNRLPRPALTMASDGASAVRKG